MHTRAEPATLEPTETPAVAPRLAPAIATVLALQRSAGNAAVTRRLARFTGGVATPTFSGSKSRPMLKRGSTDPHVVELQTMLGVPATGTFDDATAQAVIAFQNKNGLNTDCIVGPLTWGALDRVNGTPSGTNTPDQHEGAHIPTADEQNKVQELLSPARGKDDAEWDGKNDPAKRTSLRTNLHLAMRVALDEIMVKVEGWAKAPRMDIAKLEPTGKEAKRLTDDQFKPLVAAAARTSSQESGLAAFDYTAGVNLHDAADTTKRPPDAEPGRGLHRDSATSRARTTCREHHLDRDRTRRRTTSSGWRSWTRSRPRTSRSWTSTTSSASRRPSTGRCSRRRRSTTPSSRTRSPRRASRRSRSATCSGRCCTRWCTSTSTCSSIRPSRRRAGATT